MIAILKNRRPAPTCNGSHIADMHCPACGYHTPVTFGGWTALSCPGCDRTLYRSSASQKAKERERAAVLVIEDACHLSNNRDISVWDYFERLFGMYDAGYISLKRIKSITYRLGASVPMQIDHRRHDWIQMRGPGAGPCPASIARAHELMAKKMRSETPVI
jgi:hypothetical protein